MKSTTTKKANSAISMSQFNEVWDRMSDDLAEAFRMPEDEKDRFKNKALAKLIAAIPLMAGCDDAERTAVSHLGTYILSNRGTKHYYNADPGDNTSVFERLRLISNFKGGNQDIIAKGMALIALTMLYDYKRDIHIDETLGKYNPVGDKVFDYDAMITELEARRKSIQCEQMDELYDDNEIRGFWTH